MSFTYVISATAFMQMLPSGFEKEQPEQHAIMVAMVNEGLARVRKRCSEIMEDPELKISVLYNAFTEAGRGNFYRRHNFQFDEIYADSGGLQVVTIGKQLTPELKERIYQEQKTADFGFCFDEIPLRNKEGIDVSGNNSRNRTNAKLFFPEEFKTCAIHTAENIKKQTEAFRGSKTKAFYILQGNTQDEMVEWFKTGADIIGEKGFEYIQGIAPADTCMGNGYLETANMMAACRRIINDFGTDYSKKHIHLLGIGSPRRLLPAAFLKKSGFIPEDFELSFDSSTASLSYTLGNQIDSDGSKPNGDLKKTLRLFSRFYDEMGDIMEKYCPSMNKEWYMRHTESYYLSVANTCKNAPPEFYTVMRASISLVCIWQLIGFFQRLKNDMECDKTRQSGIGYLSQVKDMSDFNCWMRDFGRFIKSSKIDRKQDNTLDALFE